MIIELKKLFNNCLDLFLPHKCYICGAFSDHFEENPVCPACEQNIRPALKTRPGIPHVDNATGLFEYGDTIKTLLSLLKFEGCNTLGNFLQKIAARAMVAVPCSGVEIWLPVPLYHAKLKKRGYNQVDLIFENTVTSSGGAYDKKLLIRQRNTPSLFEKNADERRAIINGAFLLGDAQKIKGAHVGILDDILTTGSTVSEIAAVLKAAGAKSINVVSLSYVN